MAADLLCCDSINQCASLGELHHARALEMPQRRIVLTELGNIVSGNHPGRTTAKDTTVADLTGIGTQDSQIALQARSLLAPDKIWRHQSTDVSAIVGTL